MDCAGCFAKPPACARTWLTARRGYDQGLDLRPAATAERRSWASIAAKSATACATIAWASPAGQALLLLQGHHIILRRHLCLHAVQLPGACLHAAQKCRHLWRRRTELLPQPRGVADCPGAL